MTAKQKLERLQSAHKNLHETLDSFFKMLGHFTDGPFSDAIFGMERAAIQATADSIGVEFDVLEWFIYENKWGNDKIHCQRDNGERVVIDSIDSFLQFEGVHG